MWTAPVSPQPDLHLSFYHLTPYASVAVQFVSPRAVNAAAVRKSIEHAANVRLSEL